MEGLEAPSLRSPPAWCPEGEAFSYYRRLARVRSYVLANYPEHITLADAAQVAGMERTAFSAFFHRKTGVCFRDWLAAVRVARAKELLSSGNLPVRRVAHQVGFANVRSFQRAFHRIAGCAPIRYKIRSRPS